MPVARPLGGGGLEDMDHSSLPPPPGATQFLSQDEGGKAGRGAGGPGAQSRLQNTPQGGGRQQEVGLRISQSPSPWNLLCQTSLTEHRFLDGARKHCIPSTGL